MYPQFKSLVVAGHGNGNHPSDEHYLALDRYLQSVSPNYSCATLEAAPSIRTIITREVHAHSEQVIILPLLFSAGKHVLEDIVGSNDTSWKSQFLAEGILCEADLVPLGEIDEFFEIWIERLGVIVSTLVRS